MVYRLLYDHALVHTDPEAAHHVAVEAIALAGRTEPARRALKCSAGRLGGPVRNPRLLVLPREVPGVLGLCAGMDKNAEAVLGMDALGFGFVEVGTVTALPQPGNPRPRLWRHPEMRALRNQMGFNNDGAAAVGRRLRELRRSTAGRAVVVGVNLGKTRTTPLEDAVEDYRASTHEVARWADHLVVNVSSPNTPGLRDLQQVGALRPIVRAVRDEARRVSGRDVPVLVKLAPDLEEGEVSAVAAMVVEDGLAGVVAVNTTVAHDLGPGGLSGPPLRDRALTVVRLLRRELGPRPVIIASGGITDAASGQAFLDAGADLLQAYTAFVYEGPFWPGRVNRELARAAASAGPGGGG
ncbi:MAG: quinone-dependent dihydroorotate dehydrogenase [Actinomycetota bacterium]